MTEETKAPAGARSTLMEAARRKAEEREAHVLGDGPRLHELHGDSMISDATWSALAKRLDERQLIELPIIVGQYQTVAYYQNSLRLRLHTGNLGLKAR